MALTTVPASLSATALTLTTAAQPNITSVGTLTGLTLGGDLTITDKIIHSGDTDTFFRFAGANDIRIVAGNVEHAAFDGTIVFNQSGADMDLRVESTGKQNMLFVDAGNDRVGIGTNSPGKTLDVEGAIRALNTAGSAAAELDITSGATWRIRSNPTSGTNSYGLDIIKGGAGTDVKMTIDSSGNLLVGTTNILPAINNVEGIALSTGSYGGRLEVSRAGAEPVSINRKTNDGSLMSFKKDGTTVGSIGASGGDLVIGTGDTGIHFHDGVDSFIPWNVSTANYRDAGIDLGTSSYRYKNLYISGRAYINDGIKLDSGDGIYFGQDGTSANKLDDYEKGTWSVTSGVGLTITAAVYTKVGRIVHVIADLTFSSGSTSGSDAALALPFNNANTYSGGSLNYTDYSGGTPVINIEGHFLKFRTSVSGSNLSYAQVAGKRFIFHATYFAA